MTGIFRADDIRGKFGADLTIENAKKIGYAINKYVKSDKLILAYDNRLSSPKLKKALISELDKTIIVIGQVPTPVFYFVLDLYKKYYGVMVTASHLSKEFNGFKINRGSWALTYSTGIKKIELLAEKYQLKKHKHKVIKRNMNNAYFSFILPKIKLKKRLTVAVDGGNGVAGPFLVRALKKLNCKVIELHCNPNPNFPYHTANPLINKNVQDLQGLIKKTKVDIGIALDGDGDRIRIISPKAEILDNEVVISLLAKYVLSKRPKSNIVYSSICSDLVKTMVKKCNGTPIMEKVGHSFMKNTSIKKKAELWGEYSGHFGFKEINYNDDGIYAALKLCELISKYPEFWQEARLLSKMYIAPAELRIKVKESQKAIIMRNFFNLFKKYKKSRKDGLRIYFSKDSWALIRPSNTESVISIRFQAKNKTELKLINVLIKKSLKNSIKSKQKN
ncbi:phosphomannomutase/phosphoglucomutase [Candidatus Woesearchaeota archaeon]|nr:phosphomannomutase/phosphoglucomutase [Candidatus Woesearchaeota archaeon]